VKKGDLVKLKPEAAEGDAESLGVGLIIEEGKDDWNKEFIYIQWLKSNGKPWFRYKDDVELVSESERSTGSRGSS
jgi:hypothetical protein